MGADLKVLNNKTGLYKSHPPPPWGMERNQKPKRGGREGKRVRKEKGNR